MGLSDQGIARGYEKMRGSSLTCTIFVNCKAVLYRYLLAQEKDKHMRGSTRLFFHRLDEVGVKGRFLLFEWMMDDWVMLWSTPAKLKSVIIPILRQNSKMERKGTNEG